MGLVRETRPMTMGMELWVEDPAVVAAGNCCWYPPDVAKALACGRTVLDEDGSGYAQRDRTCDLSRTKVGPTQGGHVGGAAVKAAAAVAIA